MFSRFSRSHSVNRRSRTVILILIATPLIIPLAIIITPSTVTIIAPFTSARRTIGRSARTKQCAGQRRRKLSRALTHGSPDGSSRRARSLKGGSRRGAGPIGRRKTAGSSAMYRRLHRSGPIRRPHSTAA
jgi:hypothetical protein